MSDTGEFRNAVVTGAASGIGQECCRRLLAEGWRVWALDVAEPALQALAAGLGGDDRLTALVCDVRNADSVTAAFAHVAAHCDGLDALLCSAGVLRGGPLMAMAIDDFDVVFAVNTRGAWLCAQAALPLLRRRAAPAMPARIVMVGSIASIRPKIGGGAYAASKAALHALVRVLSGELAAEHILVNAVAPGTVDTPMVASARAVPGTTYRPSGNSPLGRIATPADVVAVMHFLLQPASNYVTGTWIPVDGGTSAAHVVDASQLGR